MATTQLVTADDLAHMPDDAWQYELIDGELQRMSPAFGEHGEVEVAFISHLDHHVRPRRLGKVYSGDTGFVFSRDPDTVLCPDVAFVHADRLPPPPRRRYMTVIPDLVVEVVSPSNSAADVAQRVRRYLEAGVRLIWLAYAKDRRVVAHAPGQAPREYGIEDVLDGGGVLPGFRLALADLFEG